ncbi:MAG: methyltransferase [Dysgonomonas sp.]|nr:methyltransferase [Dysgonomonas sp.]
MANPFFRFKQFTVYHDKCAMKVGTDGVLLGIWANTEDARTCLDIGTGTGLISLMLAQKKNNLQIKSIDIDADAIIQAKENISASPFSKQIECKLISLQDYDKECIKKYDLIVSNPPFFNDSLKSPDHQRTLARHTDSLTIDELVKISAKLLSENGKLSLIYPAEYRDTIINIANKNQLSVAKITNVFPTPTASVKRILIELSKKGVSMHEDNLVIEIERHVYSDEFRELAKDFYLKL